MKGEFLEHKQVGLISFNSVHRDFGGPDPLLRQVAGHSCSESIARRR